VDEVHTSSDQSSSSQRKGIVALAIVCVILIVALVIYGCVRWCRSGISMQRNSKYTQYEDSMKGISFSARSAVPPLATVSSNDQALGTIQEA
jgi:uncharacterized membrane protein YidH (DUF202 family)